MEQVIQFGGALGILTAFVAVQLGRLTPATRRYLWLNAGGAGLLTVSAVIERQWGFVLLEGVWTIVALIGLARMHAGPDPMEDPAP